MPESRLPRHLQQPCTCRQQGENHEPAADAIVKEQLQQIRQRGKTGASAGSNWSIKKVPSSQLHANNRTAPHHQSARLGRAVARCPCPRSRCRCIGWGHASINIASPTSPTTAGIPSLSEGAKTTTTTAAAPAKTVARTNRRPEWTAVLGVAPDSSFLVCCTATSAPQLRWRQGRSSRRPARPGKNGMPQG